MQQVGHSSAYSLHDLDMFLPRPCGHRHQAIGLCTTHIKPWHTWEFSPKSCTSWAWKPELLGRPKELNFHKSIDFGLGLLVLSKTCSYPLGPGWATVSIPHIHKSSHKAPETLTTPKGIGKNSFMFQNLKSHGYWRCLPGKTWRKGLVPSCGSRIMGIGATDSSIFYNSWCVLCSPGQT